MSGKYGHVCIPDSIIDTSGSTATANDILGTYKTIDASGNLVVGTMETISNQYNKSYIYNGSNNYFPSNCFYTRGAVLKGERNLRPEFIRRGETIFGVEGTMDPYRLYYFQTSDNTAPISGTDSFLCTDGTSRTLCYTNIDLGHVSGGSIDISDCLIYIYCSSTWSIEYGFRSGSGAFTLNMWQLTEVSSGHGWNRYAINSASNSSKMYINNGTGGIRLPLPLNCTTSEEVYITLTGHK